MENKKNIGKEIIVLICLGIIIIGLIITCLYLNNRLKNSKNCEFDVNSSEILKDDNKENNICQNKHTISAVYDLNNYESDPNLKVVESDDEEIELYINKKKINIGIIKEVFLIYVIDNYYFIRYDVGQCDSIWNVYDKNGNELTINGQHSELSTMNIYINSMGDIEANVTYVCDIEDSDIAKTKIEIINNDVKLTKIK